MENVLNMTPAQSRKRQWKVPAIWMERLEKDFPQLDLEVWSDTTDWRIKNVVTQEIFVLTAEMRDTMTPRKFAKMGELHSISWDEVAERIERMNVELGKMREECIQAVSESRFTVVSSLGDNMTFLNRRIDVAKAARTKALLEGKA